MKRLRLLLADDHTLVLEGIRKILEADFELVGTVEDGHALLAAAESHKPDIVLLDISMPGLNGIDAARRLHKAHPGIKIIFLTMHADPVFVEEALRIGASGYLLKRSAASELLTAIREVAANRLYVTPMVTRDVFDLLLHARRAGRAGAGLTQRQREVLQLVAEGRSNKEIASVLDISPKTVEFHKSAIMRELGIRTTAELTRHAARHGLVEI